MNFGNTHPGLQPKNRKILFAAGDRARMLELGGFLGLAGYLITVVDSGAAALDAYLPLEPDLILLDVELLGTNAFEVCRTFRMRHGSDAAPVILVASRHESEAAVEGLAAGAVDYLAQPFREAEVLARLRMHVLNRLRLVQLNKDDLSRIRFLRTAAHDLRNPLVSIRAMSNFLRAGTVGRVNPEQRDLLDTIYEASQSTLDLVNELFDVSVLEDGEIKLYAEPTALARLLETTVKQNNAIAAQKGSHIVVNTGPLPERMVVDASKIRQVLNNLLSNAIKFSPPGSTIEVGNELTARHCAIVIRDEGPGIVDSEQTKLFKDFGRTSVKPTAGETSTGLGLSICQKIMHAHGGSIQTDNLPGGGAEFRITFPIAT